MLYTLMGAKIVLHDSKHVVYFCGYICSYRIDLSLKSDQPSKTPVRDVPRYNYGKDDDVKTRLQDTKSSKHRIEE